jgi:outer membrane protein TolC
MKKYLIFLFLFSLITGNSKGQNLEDYLMEAAENNPGLKAGFLRYHAALERVPQAGALPDPQLSFGIFVMPMERFAGDQMASVSLMQMFPWTGTLTAAKEEMSWMARAEYEAFRETKSELFYEVRTAWHALQLLESELEVTRENLGLLMTMEQIALARFKSGGQAAGTPGPPQDMNRSVNQTAGSQGNRMGGMAMQGPSKAAAPSGGSNMAPMGSMESIGGGMADVLRIRMEINEMQNRLSELEEKRVPLLARFNLLLNKPAHAQVSLPDTLTTEPWTVLWSDVSDSVMARNPMVKMLELEEASLVARAKMNRKMGLPMIGVGLQYDIFRPGENTPAMMNGRNMLMPMATISVPLWRKKYDAAVREAEVLRQSVAIQIQETSNRLVVSYEEVHAERKDASRRMNLFQDQALLSEQILNILIAQYSAEGTRFEEVLRMQQQLLEYRLKYLEAITDGNVAAAGMMRLLGR